MVKPYSENVIFFDTEFSSLDSDRGKMLSFAMIKSSGEELYLELEFKGDADEWVKKNILPTLKSDKVSKEEAIRRIKEFIGDRKPYVIAYVNQFDMIYLYKLFGLDEFNDRFEWIPVDFASILFSKGINPEALVNREQDFFDMLQIDLSRYVQHDALGDARLLREVYMRLL